MSDDKCVYDASRECVGVKQANKVMSEVHILDQRLSDYQSRVQDTTSKFGARIGKLEAHNDVQDEQMRQIKETQSEIKHEIEQSRREQKDSISDLKSDHKESMNELKRTTKEILDVVTPMQHKLNDVDYLKKDVNELKIKPAKRWESIVGQIITLIVAALVGAIISRFGLS